MDLADTRFFGKVYTWRNRKTLKKEILYGHRRCQYVTKVSKALDAEIPVMVIPQTN